MQTVDDARRLADAGVDAIVLSNHGGRQLDRAPVPFHLLPDVVDAVGSDLEVHLDTGIMSGQDIVAAIAHGAHFTLVGRAYLYGLMAGGREGVDRTIEILRGQIERTMRLLGVATPRRARARPRHPAAAAGAEGPMSSGTAAGRSIMETNQILDLGPTTRAVAARRPRRADDQLDAPTPCPAYTVGDLVDHIGGLTLAFTAAARKDGSTRRTAPPPR